MNGNSENYPLERGQSIVIVAFLLVALVIMAAIAVDITGAYQYRRIAQNAADAAALAAAQELGHHLRGDVTSDANVQFYLEDFGEERNRTPRVTGRYLDADGAPLADIGLGSIPSGAMGVEATAFITAPTFFGGIIGLDGLPLEAEAAAEFDAVCYGGKCLLPISVYSAGYLDDDSDTFVDFVNGQCYNLWDGMGGGNFGWLNWSNQGDNCQFSCQDYDTADCSADCLDYNMNPLYCEEQPEDMVKIDDLVGGSAGVKNADVLRHWLDVYIQEEMIARFVVYDETTVFGNKATCGVTKCNQDPPQQKGQFYIVAGFGAFQITGYRLSNGKGGAVMTDTHGINPEDCWDYPGSNGLCCAEGGWYEVVDEETGHTHWECYEDKWIECEYNTGNVNRITGIARIWTADAYETCDAVGNFLTPHLTR